MRKFLISQDVVSVMRQGFEVKAGTKEEAVKKLTENIDNPKICKPLGIDVEKMEVLYVCNLEVDIMYPKRGSI